MRITQNSLGDYVVILNEEVIELFNTEQEARDFIEDYQEEIYSTEKDISNEEYKGIGIFGLILIIIVLTIVFKTISELTYIMN